MIWREVIRNFQKGLSAWALLARAHRSLPGLYWRERIGLYTGGTLSLQRSCPGVRACRTYRPPRAILT